MTALHPVLVALAALGVGLFVVPRPVAAAEATPPTAAECRSQYDACRADCTAKHANDEIKRTACLPVCSARYAACDARAAFEKARPWLEDKADKTKEFLEDLMRDPPADDPAPQSEEPATTKT